MNNSLAAILFNPDALGTFKVHSWSGRAKYSFRAVAGFSAFLLSCSSAFAATAPALGTNSTYGVVSSTWNDTSSTPVTGAGCTTTKNGTPTVTVGAANPLPLVPCNAQNGIDQGTALANLNAQGCTSLGGAAVALETINLGHGPGVFSPGCYSSGGAMSIGAGTVNLNGAGVYIFRSAGTLTTAVGTNVTVTGGACEADVFWAPGAATTLGATSSFKGSILDGVGHAINVGTTTSIVGRLLSFGGVVTTNTDTIAVPSCTTTYPAPVPTLSEWAMFAFALLVIGFGVHQQRRRQL
jgi:hypothetical protein